MSPTPIEVAQTFFDHWSANRIDEAIDMLAEDVLYDNVPFPDIVGRENVRKFHMDFGIGSTFTVDWKVVQIAAAGNVVRESRYIRPRKRRADHAARHGNTDCRGRHDHGLAGLFRPGRLR